jgi:hypothetical protein
MIQQFCEWLSATPLSQSIQNAGWLIPATQTVHIVSIAIVMTSMAMLDLRLIGIAGRRQSLSDMSHRFLPWVWITLIVLLCTGIILIIGEPGRELLSVVFWTKMGLLITALILTATFQQVLQRNSGFWERNRGVAILLGSVSLIVWIGIVAAGRWIAYVEHG